MCGLRLFIPGSADSPAMLNPADEPFDLFTMFVDRLVISLSHYSPRVGLDANPSLNANPGIPLLGSRVMDRIGNQRPDLELGQGH